MIFGASSSPAICASTSRALRLESRDTLACVVGWTERGMTITPIIDDTKLNGSDEGLPMQLRLTSASSFALRTSNLDHADPQHPAGCGVQIPGATGL